MRAGRRLGQIHLHRVGEQRRGDDGTPPAAPASPSTSGVVLISAIGACALVHHPAMLASCGNQLRVKIMGKAVHFWLSTRLTRVKAL